MIYRVLSAAALLVAFALTACAPSGPDATTEPTATAAEDTPEGTCRRVPFRGEQPGWTISGAWHKESGDLLVADIVGGRILRYSPQGDLRASLKWPGYGELEFMRPLQIVRAADGYVIDDLGDHWLWLDRHLEPVYGVDLRSQGLELQILRAVLLRGQIFGWTRDPDSDRPGWITVDADSGQAVAFEPEELPTQHIRFWTVQGPLLTATRGRAYQLLLADPPRIREIDPTPRELTAFPSGFDSLPEFSPPTGPSSDAARFGALETFAVPVGLHNRGGMLYLLTRRPGDEGTLWELSQIDPRRDRLLHTVRLPTRAPHLVVVPGAEEWALIEKGSVVATGQQKIENVVFVQSAAIESPAAGARLAASDCR